MMHIIPLRKEYIADIKEKNEFSQFTADNKLYSKDFAAGDSMEFNVLGVKSLNFNASILDIEKPKSNDLVWTKFKLHV